MFTRRDFLQVTAATAALCVGGGLGSVSRAAATQKITQDELLSFDAVGQITLLNFTDLHAQLKPIYFREPSSNLGISEVKGLPPHLTGEAMLSHFGLKAGSPEAHAFSSADFSDLARDYGKIGGLDRMATLVKSIRAERPNKTLLLDGGDTWQGSYTSLHSKGEDMVRVMNEMNVEAMTAHWEFTYGTDRVKELTKMINFPFLAGNVRDTEWEEEVFDSTAYYEKSGLKIAVIGQAFPYTPVANPRYMIPTWSFGIQEKLVQKRVNKAQSESADLIVFLSHNGFDVDRKLASRVNGIDVILTGHTHDAIPAVVTVNNTLLVASGSHGKFLARLDLDIQDKKVKEYSFRLIPVFSDAITPDPDMAALISEIRKPHERKLSRVLGKTDSLLYRRGNFNGTFDDLICQALMSERDTEISLSPGFRWGSSLLPGQDITVEHVFNQTAITYPNVYRSEMSGQLLKDILEDVADNLFNPDPYYQQGGDMVRAGGLGYAVDITKRIGSRISDMTLMASGKKISATKNYTVAGWASVNEGTEGPPVYDLVSKYIESEGTITVNENPNIKVTGA